MSETKVVEISEEMKRAYLDYAMSVIVGRALPDVRDGLKPVQRRILYAMYEEGLLHNKKHSKCAGVVGTVLKFYHPHGDSSVYDALVRLAQDWNMRYPLVDGQGNFGSIDGDPPAAYRYTEARLSRIGEELLRDIDKDTVDFNPNFDESKKEPSVLPSRIPNLLVNGADGIAVGMATHFPPHNLSEVIDAVIYVLDNPEATLEEIMKIIKGPDFPTGGIILGKKGLYDCYASGKGVIKIRAKAEIVENKNQTLIIIKEIPYQENKARILEKIADLVNEKVIEGISKIKDESNRHGIRVVIELKKDATPQVVLNQLYKHTPLQTSYGTIMLALLNNKPTTFTLMQYLQTFIDFRLETLTRKTLYELSVAKNRLHILEGLLILTLNLDKAINIIKNSADPEEARNKLCADFNIDDIQARAILELRLQKLTKLERDSILAEKNKFEERVRELTSILADRTKLKSILKEDLLELKAKFGDERRTEIQEFDETIDSVGLIEDEEVVIVLTNQGYVKRIALNEFKLQKRGGKGVFGGSVIEEDFVSTLIYATNLTTILAISSFGRVFSFPAYQVPIVSRTARGRAIQNFLDLKPDETVSVLLPIKTVSEDISLVLATKSGLVKRMLTTEFKKIRKTGITGITLRDNDKVIGGVLTSNKSQIILTTRQGMSIRFPVEQIRLTGRSSIGIKGIDLRESDHVVGLVSCDNPERVSLLTICENGFGKRTPLSEYRLQNRGGSGVIDIKTSGRNGYAISSFPVEDDSELILITSSGKATRIEVKGIRLSGRNTQGVKLIDLLEGEKVVAASLVYTF